ncbi:hypothetical protein ABIA33_006633 [Streptacidiphilus sp. MAP12-16]|uniref:hypothetical protein n=1 Tax=Streptacidiphilus sp. MAP12-16 TaxID=3156300 RepID=UPI003519BAEE
MSPTPDRSAALRNRNARRTDVAVSSARVPSGRPADLVITSEMVPAPAVTGASGPLSEVEQHELGLCEQAVANLTTATWLAGKALQAIRDAKLYRHTHTRFEDYVTERWDISERAAYLMIEEWALAEQLNQVLGRPATASHVRALLPVGDRFGLDAAAEMYQQLLARAQAEQVRLTAAMTSQVVKAVLKSAGRQAEAVHFKETAHQLITAQALPLSPPSPPPPQRAQPISSAAPRNGAPEILASSTRPTTPDPGLGLLQQAVGASHADLQNLAGDHKQVTVTAAVTPTTVNAAHAPVEMAPPAASQPRAVALFREILDHIGAIERCLGSEAIGPTTEGEAAEFNELADNAVERLRAAVHALEHDA